MRGCFKAMLATMALGILATPAFAQGQGGRGGGGMGGGGMGGVGLISNVGVQKELKLDEVQMQKATDFSEENREKMRELYSQTQGLEGEERMAKMQELNRTHNAEAMKTLGTFMKPEQVKRFEQIVLQQRGAEALTDPVVAKNLKVTEEQTGKVKALMGEQRTRMMEAQQEASGDRQAAMQKGTAIRKETNTKVMALMTDAQKATWKEMAGEPFEITYAPRAR